MQASFAAQSLRETATAPQWRRLRPVFLYNMAEYYGFSSSIDFGARNAIIIRVSIEHLI